MLLWPDSKLGWFIDPCNWEKTLRDLKSGSPRLEGAFKIDSNINPALSPLVKDSGDHGDGKSWKFKGQMS